MSQNPAYRYNVGSIFYHTSSGRMSTESLPGEILRKEHLNIFKRLFKWS